MPMPEPQRPSLDEVNRSVAVPNDNAAFLPKFLAYSGPGALVAVGYMDPGNWLTSLAGGSQYRYQLLAVLTLSILVAMFMQSLAIKLGVVARRDLAQTIAERVPTPLRIMLWILNEIAMMATDLTGVVGTAIALKLLFNLPLVYGILLTIADVLIVLVFLRFGIRRVEFIVLIAILAVGVIFAIEVSRAHPDLPAIFQGILPTANLLTDHRKLILSVGIIGATIMPHNLYLHSSLAQSRRYDYHDPRQVNEALRFGKWDSNVHLIAALIINALLLILGGTLFLGRTGDLTSLRAVFEGLKNPTIVGSLASPVMSWLFAFALLITGLISSITSTLSGQIVMEGYVHIRLPLWQRRLLTRFVTLVPILVIGWIIGFNDRTFEHLIIYAQVTLSVALPFTLFPMIALTGSSKLLGNHANHRWVTALGYFVTAIITVFNAQLLWDLF